MNDRPSNRKIETTGLAGAITARYAPINGLKMYYEIHDPGKTTATFPLVLLHGSFSATETSFGRVLPRIEKTRQVISIEQQGHGHTADTNRPLSIEQMGEDTVELLRQIGIPQVDLFGYSLGSGIALDIAIRHPEVVHKLVLAGGVSYTRAGFHPGMMEGMETLKPEMLMGTPFYDEYMQIAPHPEDFPKLVEKVKSMDRNLHDWAPEEIASILAPALLIIGDADIVRPEHVVEMFRLFGGGISGDTPAGLPPSRLAILPGTTHLTLMERAGWLADMVTEFLDAPMPED